MSKVRRGVCDPSWPCARWCVRAEVLAGTRGSDNTSLADWAGLGYRGGKRIVVRTLEPDLLTQLAWGQVFPEESSFVLGPLVGGFFPELPQQHLQPQQD